ncbi:MAG TPA: NAD-dependent epimerase/dehydratase family protein [Gemmatimonadaceae bacterium]|nr:NAD-dependent epimerase/dehydratase family protein [Gemmatimonadaceae bacterium]
MDRTRAPVPDERARIPLHRDHLRGDDGATEPSLSATIFVAGASGVLGLRTLRLLHEAGYILHGTTRSASKASALIGVGAWPVIVDVFDRDALITQMVSIQPSIVLHLLTDLSRPAAGAFTIDAIAANARIRTEGTRNLIAAARAAGAERIVAQSIAWVYADGALPHTERDPLDVDAEGARAISVGGVVALEDQVLSSPRIAGLVLRNGRFYGPDTGTEHADPPAVHVDAAAHAALLAIERASTGVFNIADDNAVVSTEKAKRELGWDSSFRLPS